MRRRTIAIIIAVVLALAAAALVVWYVSTLRQDATVHEQTQPVLVATADIPALTTGEYLIEQGLVQQQSVVVSSVAPGALSNQASLQGKVLTVPVAKGQQLLESQLGAPEQQSLSFQIKAGMRAITLPVDRDNGVGGSITKGDRVDVIATFTAEQFSQLQLPLGSALTPADAARIQLQTGLDVTTAFSPLTRVILQQVEVLAMDPLLESQSRAGVFAQTSGVQVPNKPVITLMVTPADAEKLVFAENFGSVWFTLVPAGDTTPVSTPGQALPSVVR